MVFELFYDFCHLPGSVGNAPFRQFEDDQVFADQVGFKELFQLINKGSALQVNRRYIHGNGQRRYLVVDPSSDDLAAFLPHIII